MMQLYMYLLKIVILDAYNRFMGQIVILGVCNRSIYGANTFILLITKA